MFWRFNYMASHIDALLDKEDVTLQQLMDEDDVVQECKSQNKKLLDFITLPNNLEQLINYVTCPPSEEEDERLRYKYPSIACDLIASDVSQLTDMLVTTDNLMSRIYTFLDSDTPLNPLQASFFSKIMGLLIARKSELLLEFMKSQDTFIDRILYHIGTSAIMDLLLRLITCVDSPENSAACINWLSSQNIVQRLIAIIDSAQSSEIHTNAAQSLCDIIRLSRERSTDDEELRDKLLAAVESKECVTELLNHMFTGEPMESVVVNGLYVLQTLIEFRKIGLEGFNEPPSESEMTQFTRSIQPALEAILLRLDDLHKLLLSPPSQHYAPMPTTTGSLNQPLGLTRLQVARLVSSLVLINNEDVVEKLHGLGTIGVLMELFFKYSLNNFLHSQVEQCLMKVLESASSSCPLVIQLYKEFHIMEQIMAHFQENKAQLASGGQRKGYMGHLTRIANAVVAQMEKNPAEMEQILSQLEDDVVPRWKEFVETELTDINKVNTVDLVGGAGLQSSSDDEEEEFHAINFPQDDALQRSFEDYQLQQMTSNFPETFGFNEDEFSEHIENPCMVFADKIANLNFELNAVDDDPISTAMFEQACKNRIHQFDSGDSDEELWEDKDLNFSQMSDTKHSSLIMSRRRDTAGRNLSDEENYEENDFGLEEDDMIPDREEELTQPSVNPDELTMKLDTRDHMTSSPTATSDPAADDADKDLSADVANRLSLQNSTTTPNTGLRLAIDDDDKEEDNGDETDTPRTDKGDRSRRTFDTKEFDEYCQSTDENQSTEPNGLDESGPTVGNHSEVNDISEETVNGGDTQSEQVDSITADIDDIQLTLDEHGIDSEKPESAADNTSQKSCDTISEVDSTTSTSQSNCLHSNGPL